MVDLPTGYPPIFIFPTHFLAMLSLLKSALNHRLQKSNKTVSNIQDTPPKLDTIDEQLKSEFLSLWQTAKQESKAGNRERARNLLYEALEYQPNNTELLCNLGKLERKMEFYDDARDNLLTALHLEPHNIRAYLGLGDLNLKINEFDEALNYYEKAHEIEPSSPFPLNGIGNALIKKLDLDNALVAYQKAVDAAPGYSVSYCNLGHCYSKMKAYDKAIVPLKIAQALDPTLIESYINLQFAYYTQGKLRLTYQTILKGLALDPNNEGLHWSLSWLLLLFKRFDRAWLEYEYRFSPTGGDVVKRSFPFPLWNGEDLTGKTIFVAAEQGLGDQLMFASCLPDLIEQADHCIVECDKKLAGLMQQSFTNIQVLGTQNTDEPTTCTLLPNPINYYTHIGSLPRWFRKDIKSFYPIQAYIRANEQRVSYWKEQLATLGNGLKVGISWRGGIDKTRNFLRTIPISDWEAIFRLPNIHFINLQYGDCEQDLQEAQKLFGINIHHWPEAIQDYQETAALVSSLDLVISVCTSAIHLSGALGQHTWVLVPLSPEWRYLANDETLPWYQNVKLFRQQELWQWQPVIDRVASELAKL